MNRQAGAPARGPARRGLFGHLDPHLREAPRLVQGQLAAAHVGGVIHLQHHVRQGVATHFDPGTLGPRRAWVQIHGLVRLQDAPPGSVSVAQQEVGCTDCVDRRAAHQGDPCRQAAEALPRQFVVDADRLAHHGDLGSGVPVLDAALVVGDLGARYAHRPAAGETPAAVPRAPPGAVRWWRGIQPCQRSYHMATDHSISITEPAKVFSQDQVLTSEDENGDYSSDEGPTCRGC